MNKIRIGHNVNQDVTITSPLEARRLARALARIETYVQNIERVEMTFQNSVGTANLIGAGIQKKDGSRRVIFGYDIVAEEGRPFVLTVQDGKLKWSNQTVPKAYADGNTYRVYTVLVQTKDSNGALRAPETSHIHGASRYRKFAEYQHNEGILEGSEEYINPIAIRPTDVFVGMLIAGRTIGIKTNKYNETNSLIERYCNDEKSRLQITL